jgi:NHL repeat
VIGSPNNPLSPSSASLVRHRPFQLALSLFILTVGLLAWGAGTASASKQAIAFFGNSDVVSTGRGGGEFSAVRDIAVNSSGAGPADEGDIYVLDGSRIQRFAQDDNGTPSNPYDDTFPFVSAWGAGVDSAAAGSDYEICTVAVNCAAGISGGTNGSLSLPNGIAIDQDTGFVYIADTDNRRISVYEGEGTFLRSFGWGVVQSGPGDAGSGYEICVAANGDTCKTGATGPGAGQLSEDAKGIAISPADGNAASGTVYVADGRNFRVNVYALDGSAPTSFGSAADFSSEGAPTPEHVAVDSRGIIYATDRQNDSEIERYDSLNANGNGVGFLAPIAARTIRVSGGPGNALGSTPYEVTFMGPLGHSDVGQLTVSNGTTPLSGGAGASVTTTTLGGPGTDEVQKVTIAATAGQFRLTFDGQTTADLPFDSSRIQIRDALESLSSIPPAPLSTVNIQRKGLEIDPDSDGPGPDVDTLYVVRDGLSGTTVVQQFGPVNAPGFTAPPSTQDEAHGAVAGFTFVNGLGFDASSGRLFIGTYTTNGPSGSEAKQGVYVLDDAANTPPSFSLDSVGDVTATSATIHATVNPNSGPMVSYQLEYSLDGTNWKSTPSVVVGTQETPQSITAVLNPPPVGLEPVTLYHVRLKVTKAFTSTATSAEKTFTTLAAAPLAETTGAPIRTVDTAQLGGRVTPRNSATSYFFEYGTEGPCDANPCTQTTSRPAGSGALTQLVSEEISGLEPNTTYHYRLGADNGVPGSPVFGEDMTVTTQASEAPLSHGRFPGPPGSDRAYEQISPPDTGGNPVNEAIAFSVDGNRAIYRIAGGTPESESGNLYTVFYAERTASKWQQSSILPRRNSESFGAPRWSVVSDPEISTAMGGNWVEATGEVEIWGLSPKGSPNQIFDGSWGGSPEFSASDDGSLFVAAMGGMPDPAHPTTFRNYYDLTSGTPSLISLLPGELVPPCGLTDVNLSRPNSRPVSANGSLVFFTTANYCGTASKVYVRDLEAEQTKSISRTPLSGPQCDAVFLSSSPQKAFFITKSRMAGEDTPPSNCNNDGRDSDVYSYDLADETLDCLTCVSPGLDADVYILNDPNPHLYNLVVSKDGSRLYFQSPHALVPGAPTVEKDGSLYRLNIETGELAWVAGPNLDIPHNQTIDMTPDGVTILFKAKAPFLNPLNGSDNNNTAQLYRYDDRDRSLVCLSCPTDGSTPPGPVTTILASMGQGGQMSEDGMTIAFSTPTPLLGADQNTSGPGGSAENGLDVYEWRDGRYLLVTDGLTNTTPETEGPSVAGMSPDGRDLYFVAPAQLTPDALDGYRRLYDARIGGGFEYPKPPPPCPLEVCQGIPKGAPEEQAPGTGAFAGPGNVNKAPRVKKCAKGKARRKGRCVAKKTKKNAANKRANHNRRTAR